MLESKDPAIKLFGMKIPLSKVVEAAEEEEEDVIFAEKSNKEMKNQNETLTDQSEKDKNLKKPTKILPCPRCNSMETKFCYYNNYNVNQPRHFCKACQRYWTSGGTMRSVPIGAGRRKNKSNSSSSAHYHHVTISETNGPVVSFNLGDDWIAFREFLGRTRGILVFTRFTHIGTFQCCSSSPSSSPNYSPKTTLGKHSRDEGETMQRKKRNGNVLVPKTLRIDDPNEAAKSSIWTTLGIKNEVMFKGFDSKKEVKINKEESETSLVLCANPAALSRSVNFHEQM